MNITIPTQLTGITALQCVISTFRRAELFAYFYLYSGPVIWVLLLIFSYTYIHQRLFCHHHTWVIHILKKRTVKYQFV